MTAPRARERSDPPSPPDGRPPRRGGGSSPSAYASSAAGGLRGLLRFARRAVVAAVGLAGLALASLALAPPAEAQTYTEIWSATLSPEDSGVSAGYFDFGGGSIDGDLTDDDFTFAGTEYTIKQTYTGTFSGTTYLYLQTNPRMTSTSAARQDLVFIVDGTRFALSDASDPGNIGNWRWRNPGVTFTEGTDVDLSLEGIVRPRLTDAEVPSNGRAIELEFNEDLDLPSTIPSGLKDAFSVTADGHAMEISSIAKDGSDGLKLNLSATILEDQDVVVSYDRSDAGSNALDDDDGNEVRDFTTGEGGVPDVDNGSTVSRPELDSSGVGFDGNQISLIFDETGARRRARTTGRARASSASRRGRRRRRSRCRCWTTPMTRARRRCSSGSRRRRGPRSPTGSRRGRSRTPTTCRRRGWRGSGAR